MRYKAIILDFDGVILESNHIKDEAFKYTFSDYPEYLKEIMVYHRHSEGVIRFKKFKYIVESILHEPYDLDRERSLAKRFSDYVVPRMRTSSLVRGALNFLHFFYRRVPLFLVSINPSKDLNKILEMRGLKQFFKKVYATDRKDEAIEKILRQGRFHVQEVVFIGDMFSDYQACQKIGVSFLGRNSGYFQGSQPFEIFSDLNEVKKYLLKE